VRESLSEIEKLCSRARDVVGQILAFSRKSAVNKKPVLPHEIISDQVKMLRKIIPANIELRTDIDESSGAVLADATQLQQVVMNLCNNALYALQHRGGVLEIAVQPVSPDADTAASLHAVSPGRYVQISVSDTGPGIDRQIVDRIFDPFFTTKEVGKGSGMGLAVAHGIVSGHGGSISVTSEPGQGTCFTVLLPHIEAAGVARAARENRRAPGGTERILIVDDEEFIADPMKIMLERLGYRVAARNSSRDALELFRKDPHAFDLVITDLTMPVLTGDRLAAEITAVRPDLPVILMTGYNDMIDNGRFEENGITACMAKPCKKHDLAETVRRALDTM
jgi:CheY-like chemotaxis protein